MIDLRGICQKGSWGFAVAMECLALTGQRRLLFRDRFHYGGALFLPFVRSDHDRQRGYTYLYPKVVFMVSQCVRCNLGEFIMAHEVGHHEIGFKPGESQEFLVDSHIVERFNVREMITYLERNWEKVMKCGTCSVAQRLLLAKQLKDEQDEQLAIRLREGS
jgi:hypothetical protein